MIFLLRHGETLWNTLGRFQGRQDSPLTSRGVEQADHLGKGLAKEIGSCESKFEIHASPLGRAHETATRIARYVHAPIRDEPRLMEVSVGSWDGMTQFEIDNEYPGALEGTDAYDWFFRSPDGESFDDACMRVRAWLSDVSRPTIAISHGLTGRLVRGVYLGLARHEMLHLPVPQNGFFRLTGGQVDFIECNASDCAK